MSDWTSIDLDTHFPARSRCPRCGRTETADLAGQEDRMPQPDGGPCGGIFQRAVS